MHVKKKNSVAIKSYKENKQAMRNEILRSKKPQVYAQRLVGTHKKLQQADTEPFQVRVVCVLAKKEKTMASKILTPLLQHPSTKLFSSLTSSDSMLHLFTLPPFTI